MIMRKSLLILVLALVLAFVGVAVTASAVHRDCDQVYYTETTLYGDSAAAEGLTITAENNWHSHLLWETNYPVGGTAASSFRFSADGIEKVRIPVFRGLQIDSYPEDTVHLPEEMPDIGLSGAFREAVSETAPGEDTLIRVQLKSYFDYYPLNVTIDTPEIQATRGFLDRYYEEYEGVSFEPRLRDTEVLQEFFRIPVLDSEWVEISVSRDEAGNMWSSGGGRGVECDAFYFYTYSTLTDDACYLTFDTHSAEGQIVDTSLIPGGYGIYRIPYEPERTDEDGDPACPLVTNETEMVFPLDPSVRVVMLHANEMQNRLLLYTVEDEMYVVSVLDTATMELLQRLELCETSVTDNPSMRIAPQDDFVLVLLYSENKLAVMEETDGKYTTEFCCDIPLEESQYLNYYRSHADYDGEKLAIVIPKDAEYFQASSDFLLTVYDASGLLYYGKYDCSLDSGVDGVSSTYPVRASLPDAIIAEWTS